MVLYSKGRHVFGLCNDNVENGSDNIFNNFNLRIWRIWSILFMIFTGNTGSYSLSVFYTPWAVYKKLSYPKVFLPNIRFFLNWKAFVIM